MRWVCWRPEVAAKGEVVRAKSGMRHRWAARLASAGRLGSLPGGSETHGAVRKGVAGRAVWPGRHCTGIPKASPGADAG